MAYSNLTFSSWLAIISSACTVNWSYICSLYVKCYLLGLWKVWLVDSLTRVLKTFHFWQVRSGVIKREKSCCRWYSCFPLVCQLGFLKVVYLLLSNLKDAPNVVTRKREFLNSKYWLRCIKSTCRMLSNYSVLISVTINHKYSNTFWFVQRSWGYLEWCRTKVLVS